MPGAQADTDERLLDRVHAAGADRDATLELLADMCRLNALVAVKQAGSGHLGSSFSALDIVSHLLFEELNLREVGFDDPGRDVFFSSKGQGLYDEPGLYAALVALGVIPSEQLGVCGGSAASTATLMSVSRGSKRIPGRLGMGVSKGRGMPGGETPSRT